MAFKNYYEILEINSSASVAEIREAYLHISQKYKSETNEIDEVRAQLLKDINEAIEVLSNPEKRQEHDKTLQLLNNAVESPIQQTLSPSQVHVSTSDAELIGELIKSYFEKEKSLREKHDALMVTKASKSVQYFTFTKVFLCAVIIGVAYYFHSPHQFNFDFANAEKRNFTYEFETKDTTLIYSKPDVKKAKVIKGVGKGAGFNTISETVHFYKIAFINAQGHHQEGYVKKDDLIKVNEIPF